MKLTDIVDRINNKLAGELLSYDELKYHMDDVIDDINAKLNSKFPAFTEFVSGMDSYPDYNYFPDKYIRSVVVLGAAAKFYSTDEEGIDSAQGYSRTYATKLFEMQRDYSNQVPEAYQETKAGFLVSAEGTELGAPEVKLWDGEDLG
jgi:hypothetical protein